MHTPNRSRHLPWIFVGGMLVVVAVNAVLIYFAFSTWSGLATSHAYERGRGYNKALQAMERQDALGWSLRASLRPDAAGGELVIDAVDRQVQPLRGLAVEVTLVRPLGAAEKHRVELVPSGDGRYAARLPSLARGQWDAMITATATGERMLMTQRLAVP
jgi:nitrogen fixation protein FixH